MRRSGHPVRAADDLATRAAEQPWVLYVLGGVLVVSMAAAAVPKILGPIGQAWADWLERRRRAAVARDDADIADRDRQIAYLRGVADEQRREIARRDALIAAHAPWDWTRYDAAVKAGHDVTPPPPLVPYAPAPAGDSTPGGSTHA